MDEMLQRLQELEIRYTHQARLLDELNDELAAACVRIGQLEEENRRMQSHLRHLAADDYTLSPDE